MKDLTRIKHHLMNKNKYFQVSSVIYRVQPLLVKPSVVSRSLMLLFSQNAKYHPAVKFFFFLKDLLGLIFNKNHEHKVQHDRVKMQLNHQTLWRGQL